MHISSYSIILLILLLVIIVIIYKYFQESRTTRSLTRAFQSLSKIYSVVLSSLEFEDVVKQITNVILNELDYMKMKYVIVVLALIDEEKQVLRRIGISQTGEAEVFLKAYPHPFRTIEIPLTEVRNIGIKVLQEDKMKITNNVADLLYPAVDPNFVSDLQKKVGLKTSIAFPVTSKGKKLGVLIFSLKKAENKITPIEWAIMQNYVGVVGIAVENAKLFAALKTNNEAFYHVNEKLKQLDKLKDDFVSIASHELRTPMTAIRSYAWMALHRADVPLSKNLEKYLARIFLSTERSINLVNDMLNVSRIEANRIEITPESVDLISLIKDIVDETYYSKSQEKNIQFVVLEKPIPKIFADPEKLRQVFLNLVGNALKFTPNGGKITFDFFSDGKVVETSVSDDGVGISKEDQSKLFHKFSRLDSSYTAAATSGGSGLGLYISKNLVELMRGKIWVRSEGSGKGSTFTVSMPVATPELLANSEKYAIKPVGEAKGLETVVV